MEKTAYPLCWPPGRPRTAAWQRKHARFNTSFAKARERLLNEIRMLGGRDALFSSDIPRRQDGLPFANEKPKSGDPGIAVYFTRKGKSLCFVCDCYLTVADNMHAITLTVGALRGIARWGTGDMMEAAFTGFTALPPAKYDWWSTLGVTINASPEQVKEAYRTLVKLHHPDTGGDAELFRRVQEAYAEFNKTQAATA